MSAQAVRLLARPLAWLGGQAESPDDVRREVSQPATSWDDVVWAHRWRGFAWGILVAAFGVGGLAAFILGGELGVDVVQGFAVVLLYLMVTCGPIAVLHYVRALLPQYFLLRDRELGEWRLRWSTPKARDFYLGLILGVAFSAFFYVADVFGLNS